MFNVWVAGDHLYGKWLFTRLSLVMSLMVSYFVLFFFHEMSWMRPGTELSQFLRMFLPTFTSVTEPNQPMRYIIIFLDILLNLLLTILDSTYLSII